MSEIPKSRWWRGLDMHGREMGRRRPRNLKSTFCKNIKKKILNFFSCLKWNGSQKIKINWMRLKVSTSASPCYVIVYTVFSLRSALLNGGIKRLQENESTNYATKRHKTYNHGSIVKLLNFKKLQYIIMHSTLGNYIFYLFTLCFEVNCVLNNFFKSKYFWLQNSFGKIEILNFLLFLLAWICFGCKV